MVKKKLKRIGQCCLPTYALQNHDKTAVFWSCHLNVGHNITGHNFAIIP